MALARARIAISQCCNGIRRTSVRRFATEPVQTTANDGSSIPPVPPRRLSPFFHPVILLAMTVYTGFNLSGILQIRKARKELNENMRKILGARGISRESCEANIANIKQMIESGSATEEDRYMLKKNEEWLHVFNEGT